jgi:hypothetical protein
MQPDINIQVSKVRLHFEVCRVCRVSSLGSLAERTRLIHGLRTFIPASIGRPQNVWRVMIWTKGRPDELLGGTRPNILPSLTSKRALRRIFRHYCPPLQNLNSRGRTRATPGTLLAIGVRQTSQAIDAAWKFGRTLLSTIHNSTTARQDVGGH